jgi:hypothetical protein
MEGLSVLFFAQHVDFGKTFGKKIFEIKSWPGLKDLTPKS